MTRRTAALALPGLLAGGGLLRSAMQGPPATLPPSGVPPSGVPTWLLVVRRGDAPG
jgi:hypothetical protein